MAKAKKTKSKTSTKKAGAAKRSFPGEPQRRPRRKTKKQKTVLESVGETISDGYNAVADSEYTGYAATVVASVAGTLLFKRLF